MLKKTSFYDYTNQQKMQFLFIDVILSDIKQKNQYCLLTRNQIYMSIDKQFQRNYYEKNWILEVGGTGAESK